MTKLEIFLLALIIAEKVVKLTPFKWDDIIVDGIKWIFFFSKRKLNKLIF